MSNKINIEKVDLDKIVSSKPKNEHVAFKRKLKKLEELIELLKPIEQKIINIIIEEKNPIMDDIQELRLSMVRECVHPKEYLIYGDETKKYLICKFCEAKLSINE